MMTVFALRRSRHQFLGFSFWTMFWIRLGWFIP